MSVAAVTGTETVVLVVCTGGAPSASASAGLTRVRSAADGVVSLDKADSLDVVSWRGTAAAAVAVAVVVVTVSRSSGRLNCTLGVGPIRMGSRSLQTFNGVPRATGVGLHGSQIMAFKRVVSPTSYFHSALQCSAHSAFRSSAHLF